MSVYAPDALAFAFCALTFIAYFRHVDSRAARDPSYTTRALVRRARLAWVEFIMNKPGQEVLAVQTLRNSTMAATFLASTAVLLIIGVLSLIGQADRLTSVFGGLTVFATLRREVEMIKLLWIIADLFFAFFSFSVAIRLFNHVGYMIAVPANLRPAKLNPPHVAAHLNRAGDYYARGMRAYHLLIPLVFWLFGPLFLIGATIGLVFVLHRLDRPPDAADKPLLPQ